MTLNERAKQIHQLNAKWWVDIETGLPIERNKEELKMLMVSEVSEAMEGERKNLQDDKLPHRKMAEVEMADTIIRILDYAGGLKIELVNDIPADELAEIDRLPFPRNKGEALMWIVRGIAMTGEDEAIELRTIIWSIETYCKHHGYDLWGAVDEKLEYNKTRADHTAEARKLANGKKF